MIAYLVIAEKSKIQGDQNHNTFYHNPRSNCFSFSARVTTSEQVLREKMASGMPFTGLAGRVEKYFGIEKNGIERRGKSKEVMAARDVYCCSAVRLFRYSGPNVGEIRNCSCCSAWWTDYWERRWSDRPDTDLKVIQQLNNVPLCFPKDLLLLHMKMRSSGLGLFYCRILYDDLTRNAKMFGVCWNASTRFAAVFHRLDFSFTNRECIGKA